MCIISLNIELILDFSLPLSLPPSSINSRFPLPSYTLSQSNKWISNFLFADRTSLNDWRRIFLTHRRDECCFLHQLFWQETVKFMDLDASSDFDVCSLRRLPVLERDLFKEKRNKDNQRVRRHDIGSTGMHQRSLSLSFLRQAVSTRLSRRRVYRFSASSRHSSLECEDPFIRTNSLWSIRMLRAEALFFVLKFSSIVIASHQHHPSCRAPSFELETVNAFPNWFF